MTLEIENIVSDSTNTLPTKPQDVIGMRLMIKTVTGQDYDGTASLFDPSRGWILIALIEGNNKIALINIKHITKCTVVHGRGQKHNFLKILNDLEPPTKSDQTLLMTKNLQKEKERETRLGVGVTAEAQVFRSD